MATMTFKANLIPASNTALELGKSGSNNANYWNNIYAKTVTLSQDPVNNLEAATKQYVDNKVGNEAFEIPVLFSSGWYIPSTIKGTDILNHIDNCYLMIDGYGRTEINNYLIDSGSPPGPNIELFAKAYDDVYYFGTEYTMFKVTAAGNSTDTPTVEAIDFTQQIEGEDKRVNQNYSTTNASYPLLLTGTSGITSTSSRGAIEALLNNSIYANPSTGTITATTFNGALSGNASTATTASKLGTDNKGSGTKPIYLAAGVPTECSTYAGGTAVTLNGTSKAASTASFYAPTSVGNSGYILKSNGSGAPTWLQTLPVANGGTGATSFTANRIIMSGSTTTAALTTRAVTNNTSNTAITNNNTNIPTMNTIYYGLVGVNGSSQSRATTIYAPTSAGTSGQLLKSNGSGAPGWITTSIGSSMQPIYLSSGVPTACTIPSNGAWWSAVPQILQDGVMEIGKYIDFHTASNGTTDYDVRITAETTGLTISGTTVGTFSGNLSGNASTATILKSQNTASTATTEVSSWYTPTDWKHVWGQRFKDTSISTDTGDICFKLSPVYTYDSSGTLTGTNSSQSQLFMMIDGGIHIQNTYGDASSTHDCEKRNIPLMIGAPHYNHMEFDANEIMVKTSDTAMGTLWLNDNLEILANGFISRAGFGTAWIYGRTGAVVRTSSCPNGSYCTIYSVKTGRGSWECGTYNYNSMDNLYWTYIKDSRTVNGDDGQAWLAPGGEYHATKVWGAVYNDYAEMRNVPEAQNEDNPLRPGTCVREVGDGTMVPTTERLQRGCKIISDTFGFNIGETDNCKTPIAVSGRALVYLDQDREIARDYIGWPVCSGPNGTVSIMTEEEEEKYPSRIVGTISEIPDYEKWGSSDVEVNGRIWIYVR